MSGADAPRLREIHSTPEVARWWGLPEPGFPSSDDPQATRLTILVEDRIAGLIQFSEEHDADYRHARIDLFLAPELHNRGLGAEAVDALVRFLLGARGHHRVTIDPAAANVAAVRCYERAGFRRVGTLRLAERGPSGAWHDVLLMERVVSPGP